MKTSPFGWRLVFCLMLVGLGSLLGCGGVTLSELQGRNPNAKTLRVHCRPWKMGDKANILAMRSSGDYLHTDETPDALREFAKEAGIFIVIDNAAPKENALIMATDYDLVCHEHLANRSTPLEALREEKPCSVQASHAGAQQQGNLMATPGEAPCDTPKKEPKRIHVCVKPTWIKADVKEWAIFKSKDKKGSTEDRAKFDADTTQADVIFVLDPAAPPETAYYFTKDPKKLSCAKKPAKTFDQMVAADAMPDLVDLNADMKALEDQATGKTTTVPKSGTGISGTGTAGTNTTAAAKTGSGKPSASSSPDGKGPQLDTLEASIRQFAIAAALFQADTSGNLKDPNGSRYGIPNGKNVGGPNALPLQAVASLFVVVKNPLKTGKDFIKTVTQALEKKEVLIILDPALMSKEVAEELAKDTVGPDGKTLISGKVMAESLKNAGTIMPYSRAQIFTRGWMKDFQAHHIYEKQMMEDLGYTTEAIANSPAIILTSVEHKAITKKLDDARKKLMAQVLKREDDVPTKAELWAMYKEVYKGNPTWLEAIKGYFQP